MNNKNNDQGINLVAIDEDIKSKIYVVRNEKVMLDVDLAALYQVQTKVLNQSVKRNLERFPLDFMFQLSKEEESNLISQFVISSYGGRRKPVWAFTEQGIAMLSSVLHSQRAIQVNIQIMRAFTKLRQAILQHNELSDKIRELERKYDMQFDTLFTAIEKLIIEEIKPKERLGFRM